MKDQGKRTFKTFSIDEKFHVLIAEFESRGWRNQNDLEDSDFKFDFSFRLGNFNSNALNQICNDQIISSFKGMSLTSKYGMMRLLKKAQKCNVLDSNLFFPKAFDMSQKFDVDQFFR